jgi:hypothetical protein
VCAVLFAPPGEAAASTAVGYPIGAHSMLQVDDTVAVQDAMFREAAAAGLTEIRADAMLSAIFPAPPGAPDWSGLDEYVALAHRYHLRVLLDLLGTPWWIAACPAGTPFASTYRCAATDADQWGAYAGAVAAHVRGTIDDFEIVNEPDGSQFYGTPEQYGAILAASYRAIHTSDPGATVLLGGLEHVDSTAMLSAVLSTPGATFDVANLHVRDRASRVGGIVASWRSYLASQNLNVPLWVTEAGYPADPAWQTDPAYHDGVPAQARYLAATIPAMIRAGASKVFVTERDSLDGPFASEGILDNTDPLAANPSYTRRPSFYTLRALATGTHGPPPTATIIGSPRTIGATLTVRIACQGNPGQTCTGAATITTTNTTKFHTGRSAVIGLTHSLRNSSRATTTSTIGSARFSVRASDIIPARIRLNPTGRKLLATFKRLRATLKVTSTRNASTATALTANITFKQ